MKYWTLSKVPFRPSCIQEYLQYCQDIIEYSNKLVPSKKEKEGKEEEIE